MTGKNKGLPSRQNLIDAISRADLYSFVQRIFPIVSPGSPFLANWHVEAIVYALTRVMLGADQASNHYGATAKPQVDMRFGCLYSLRARPRPHTTHHLCQLRRRTGPQTRQ